MLLKTQANGWCSTYTLGMGNREVVIARLRGLLKTLRQHTASLVPDHLTDADIVELESKINAFDQSLQSKSASVNDKAVMQNQLAQSISAISALVNHRLSRSVKSMASEYPDLKEAYFISRKIRATVSATRSAGVVAAESIAIPIEPANKSSQKPNQSDLNSFRANASMGPENERAVNAAV